MINKTLLTIGITFTTLTGMGSAALITHYNMEQGSSPLIDQIGSTTASEEDNGHVYGVAGPMGWGKAAGLNMDGAWRISDSAELQVLTNNITIATWIYLDSTLLNNKNGTNSNNHRIIGDDLAWDGDGFSFGVQGSQLKFTKNGIADIIDTTGTVPTDEWVHVAVTVSSSTGIQFYVNGTATGTNSNTTTMASSDDPYAIARSYGSSPDQNQWFPGNLDELRVYDSVEDSSVIASLAAVPEPSTATLFGLGILGLVLRRQK